jgi:hypothetical protein
MPTRLSDHDFPLNEPAAQTELIISMPRFEIFEVAELPDDPLEFTL